MKRFKDFITESVQQEYYVRYVYNWSVGQNTHWVRLFTEYTDEEGLKGDIILEAKNAGKEIHARSCFLQGLFFHELDMLPKKLDSLRPYLLSLESIKKANHFNTQTLAIQYVLQKKYINYIIKFILIIIIL